MYQLETTIVYLPSHLVSILVSGEHLACQLAVTGRHEGSAIQFIYDGVPANINTINKSNHACLINPIKHTINPIKDNKSIHAMSKIVTSHHY